MGGVRCSGLIRYSVNKYLLQLYKVRRPETCDLRSPKSVNAENKETVMTNGIPSSDCRESSVLQPGLEPDVISLRPAKPRSYSKGLSQPSGPLPFESR